MNEINVKFIAKDDRLIPSYETTQAAGADLKANVDNFVIIAPGERMLIPTGVKIELPEGYEAQIRPRSGLAHKVGVTVLNTPGTIDSDYRGEIKVNLINLGYTSVSIKKYDRIAQMVISPVTRGNFVKSDNLTETERGEGGFGSTGL